ncbi:peptidylprolyl isomerase PrsA [Lactococcus cremoris]|uniref:Foldase protein PrsA n=4 Tax=Lactococcus lactis subsp. cremoris TaxID=1359 RepID=A0A1E7G5H9_LACLC|nr:peptidyl-prolyl cis-trans isomerase [Lactococcus cremoris]MCI1841127.1 peptidyl-prolyl cis-trans isomerase [Lactococcus lactis]ADJ60884.1 foldase protein prsA precursor [Lactococcus cremoris subsp. cremoris NZ9000]KEY62910.1 Foldase protein prsA [Lactococcus cremoris subsp. cremoris GE214]KKW70479.1 cystatin-like protein [Lactococcus cremoris]KZK11020.1 Foldase protein PrsA precursor Foldase clustered with pyrimidine conversion [Lactococcus cremoris]
MKFKKLGLVMATVFAGAALVTLSGCSSSDSASKDIITMKGDTIRVSDLYKEAKQFPSQPTNTLLQNLTFDKIFTKDFGKEVTDKDVNKKVKSLKDQYGSQFASALQQQGLTEASFTPYMRTQMLEQAAIDHEIEATQYTDANLKKAWESYHPDVTAYVVSETSKDAATKALDAAKKDDAGKASFEKTNAANKVTFNSTSTTVPTEVQTAAFKLKNGEFSSVIESTSASTGATSYYIVEMVKSSEKGSDMNKYKKELKNVIKAEKEQDTTFVSGVIAKYLKKNNVTVKESAFASIFSQFTQTSSTSSSK